MQPSFLLPQKNVSKINDYDENERSNMTSEEIIERCKLATVFRLVDVYGWCETIFNHISLRTTNEKDFYLTNPFGLLYSEITASKLLKVNVNGEVIRAGSSALGFNSAGFTLHSAIHEARSDINCIIHLHHPDVVAVSALKCGLLPISQQAMILGDVSYHPYSGILVDEFEKKLIIKNLGPINKVMILRNHGVVACGKDVEEAFAKLLLVISSCSIQIKAMSAASPEKLILLDRDALRARTEGLANADSISKGSSHTQWGPNEIQFEALCRMLDTQGHDTGYPYRQTNLLHHR